MRKIHQMSKPTNNPIAQSFNQSLPPLRSKRPRHSNNTEQQDILQAYQDYSSAAVVAVGIAVHTEEDNLAEDSPAPAEDIPAENSLPEDILVEDKVAPDIPSADTRPSVG
uniref:Uncharacterized protein n=1 Tax=Noccaea caerulescens TaxID=107243 RepID=A0A1J3GID2_NOCCA